MRYFTSSEDWKTAADLPDEELLDALLCSPICACEEHQKFGREVYAEALRRMRKGSGNRAL